MNKWLKHLIDQPVFARVLNDLEKSLKPIMPYLRQYKLTLEQYQNICLDHFDEWTHSKRWVVLIACLMIITLFWYLFFFQPTKYNYQLTVKQRNSVQNSVLSLTQEEKTLLAESKKDPNREIISEIESLKNKTADQARSILQVTEENVSATRLVQILKSRIANDDSLKLLRIAAVSETRIVPKVLGTSRIGLDKLPIVYSYPIELDFEGTYFSTYKFLRSIEKTWKLYWDSIEYVVLDYPRAKISIKAHLLGKGEDWNE